MSLFGKTLYLCEVYANGSRQRHSCGNLKRLPPLLSPQGFAKAEDDSCKLLFLCFVFTLNGIILLFGQWLNVENLLNWFANTVCA